MNSKNKRNFPTIVSFRKYVKCKGNKNNFSKLVVNMNSKNKRNFPTFVSFRKYVKCIENKNNFSINDLFDFNACSI